MAVQRLTSPGDPRVADYLKVADPELMRSHGLFVAEGRLVVRRLIDHGGYRIRSVLVSEAGGKTTITITFADADDVQSFSSSFTLDGPDEDSDVDLPGGKCRGRLVEISDRRSRQQEYVVGHVQHPLAVPLEVRIRRRRLKWPQHDRLHRFVDDRPHGSDIDATVCVLRGDDAFEDHAAR